MVTGIQMSGETDRLYVYLHMVLYTANMPRSHYWLQSLLFSPDCYTLASRDSRASKHGREVLLCLDGTTVRL